MKALGITLVTVLLAVVHEGRPIIFAFPVNQPYCDELIVAEMSVYNIPVDPQWYFLNSFIGTAASPCAPITDHFYTKTANESVELICEVTQQPADIIKWIDPNGIVVSSNCVASNSRYSVTCEPANAPTKYKLAFTTRWSDRGTYTCKCESSGFSMSTRLTVKGTTMLQQNYLKNISMYCNTGAVATRSCITACSIMQDTW